MWKEWWDEYIVVSEYFQVETTKSTERIHILQNYTYISILTIKDKNDFQTYVNA